MAGPFDNPFGEPAPSTIRCPKCKGAKFDAKQNQWETWRVCRDCGHRWSGGMGVGQPDFSLPENQRLVSPPGVPAPDEVRPPEFTGAPFRRGGVGHDGED